MTYQAASGAGANNMRELLKGMGASTPPWPPSWPTKQRHPGHRPQGCQFHPLGRQPDRITFYVPLAGSLIPWIDKDLGNANQGRMEGRRRKPTRSWAAATASIVIDGLCVRIGAMRCHSQALTIKLKQTAGGRNQALLAKANDWVQSGAQPARSLDERPHPGRRHRHADRPGRPHPQAGHGRRIHQRLHLRRPTAVGRRRTAARRMLRIVLDK